MNTDIFSKRLQQAINFNNIKPVDLAKKTGIGKASISCYLSGYYKASAKHLSLLSNALGVSEAWLLGFTDDINLTKKETSFDEIEELYRRNKHLLNNDDKETIKFIIEKRVEKMNIKNRRII